MGATKQDLLAVIELAREAIGSRTPNEYADLAAWLDRVQKEVEGGSEYDRLRRRVRKLEDALEVVAESAARAILDEEPAPSGVPE